MKRSYSNTNIIVSPLIVRYRKQPTDILSVQETKTEDPRDTLLDLKRRQDTRDKHLDIIDTKLDRVTTELAAMRKRLEAVRRQINER